MKPEICAPGRYMVGPIAAGSTLAAEKADKLVGQRLHRALRDVVRGAGDLGNRGPGPGAEPELDARSGQERADAPGPPGAAGGPELVRRRPGQRGSVGARDDRHAEPEPGPEPVPAKTADGSTVFNAVSWTDVSWSDVSWDAVSWSDVSWSDVSWDAVSWSDVSWTDVSWSDVSWSDVSWEDNADGETPCDGDGYELTPARSRGSGRGPRPADARREGCSAGRSAAAEKAAADATAAEEAAAAAAAAEAAAEAATTAAAEAAAEAAAATPPTAAAAASTTAEAVLPPQSRRSRSDGSIEGGAGMPAPPSPFRVIWRLRASIGGCRTPKPGIPSDPAKSVG